MFAISSLHPSPFRAEVSLLEPLRLLRPCWKLDSERCAGEGRNQSTGLDWTGLKWDRSGWHPPGLPRNLARGAALRGHPGQVRMLQKMPKYRNSHFWSWGIRSILQNVLWLGSDPWVSMGGGPAVAHAGPPLEQGTRGRQKRRATAHPGTRRPKRFPKGDE